MIKITKTNNTYEIEKGDCRPRNRIGNFDKKDLRLLYKMIGKLICERDYKLEVKKKIL